MSDSGLSGFACLIFLSVAADLRAAFSVRHLDFDLEYVYSIHRRPAWQTARHFSLPLTALRGARITCVTTTLQRNYFQPPNTITIAKLGISK
jgi:uncharacterized metal-binding protein